MTDYDAIRARHFSKHVGHLTHTGLCEQCGQDWPCRTVMQRRLDAALAEVERLRGIVREYDGRIGAEKRGRLDALGDLTAWKAVAAEQAHALDAALARERAALEGLRAESGLRLTADQIEAALRSLPVSQLDEAIAVVAAGAMARVARAIEARLAALDEPTE